MTKFQSLFFWNSRPDPDDGRHLGGGRSVSILVFLELAPGPWVILSRIASTSCFNPCFSGTRARTATPPPRPCCGPSFNPCFSGTRARTRSTKSRMPSITCFNPCFSGTRARTLYFASDEAGLGQVSILVFLELAPGPPLKTRPPELILVSILVFLQLAPGPRRQHEGPPEDHEVSILVFLELAPGQAREILKDGDPMFQSLFFWNSRPDGRSDSGRREIGTVSILVFLELAPGLPVDLQ